MKGLGTKGYSIDELYDWVSHFHDIEFAYNGTVYMLQLERQDGVDYLAIRDDSPGRGRCKAKHATDRDGDISRYVFDTVLSEPSFGGKSFFEIEQDVTVTAII